MLRLEKQHILVGQDTDSESNTVAAGMPWIVSSTRTDFVGARRSRTRRPRRTRAAGAASHRDGTVPLEGTRSSTAACSLGRVTSSRWSDAAGRAIGLAWVRADLAEDGTGIRIKVEGRLEPAEVPDCGPFYDPDGERLRS